MAHWLTGQGIRLGLHEPAPRLPAGVDVCNLGAGLSDSLTSIPDCSEDFVIADHVLHLVEDPVHHLQQMLRVLRSGGVLYIALPDGRRGVDRYRPITPVDHFLIEWRGGHENTRHAHYEQWVQHCAPKLGNASTLGQQTSESATRCLERLLSERLPIHFHAWRPDTFFDFVSSIRAEADLQMELNAFEPSRPGSDEEFIAVYFKGWSEIPPQPPVPGQVDPLESRAVLENEIERVRGELQATRARINTLRGELTCYANAWEHRLISASQRAARRALPAHSGRGRWLTRASRVGLLLIEQGPRACAQRIRQRIGW